MELSDISELHYITHVDNLESIVQHGILCHRDAEKYKHISVADTGVQARRAAKIVPGGFPLHHYANLYINARNPMLYRNCHEQSLSNLCVLRISKQVLSLPNVVVTDGNAATTRTRFHESPVGFQHIDKELIFADYWTDDDPIVADRKKWTICAEVLVPNKVESRFLIGTFVVSTQTAQSLTQKGIHLLSEVNPKMFFTE